MAIVVKNGNVGRRERSLRKVLKTNPSEGNVLVRGGLCATWGKRRDERRHSNGERGVGVLACGEFGEYRQSASEFFLNFPSQALLEQLAWLDFASRELPSETEVFVRGALGNENTLVSFEEDADDRKWRGATHDLSVLNKGTFYRKVGQNS